MKWQARSIGLHSIQKSKRFGLRLPWRRETSRVTQNLKVTEFIKSHYEQKKKKKKKKKGFCNPYAFSTAIVKTKSKQAVLGL